MVFPYVGSAVEIGDAARDPPAAVPAACRQTKALGGLAHDLPAGGIESADTGGAEPARTDDSEDGEETTAADDTHAAPSFSP